MNKEDILIEQNLNKLVYHIITYNANFLRRAFKQLYDEGYPDDLLNKIIDFIMDKLLTFGSMSFDEQVKIKDELKSELNFTHPNSLVKRLTYTIKKAAPEYTEHLANSRILTNMEHPAQLTLFEGIVNNKNTEKLMEEIYNDFSNKSNFEKPLLDDGKGEFPISVKDAGKPGTSSSVLKAKRLSQFKTEKGKEPVDNKPRTAGDNNELKYSKSGSLIENIIDNIYSDKLEEGYLRGKDRSAAEYHSRKQFGRVLVSTTSNKKLSEFYKGHLKAELSNEFTAIYDYNTYCLIFTSYSIPIAIYSIPKNVLYYTGFKFSPTTSRHQSLIRDLFNIEQNDEGESISDFVDVIYKNREDMGSIARDMTISVSTVYKSSKQFRFELNGDERTIGMMPKDDFINEDFLANGEESLELNEELNKEDYPLLMSLLENKKLNESQPLKKLGFPVDNLFLDMSLDEYFDEISYQELKDDVKKLNSNLNYYEVELEDNDGRYIKLLVDLQKDVYENDEVWSEQKFDYVSMDEERQLQRDVDVKKILKFAKEHGFKGNQRNAWEMEDLNDYEQTSQNLLFEILLDNIYLPTIREKSVEILNKWLKEKDYTHWGGNNEMFKYAMEFLLQAFQEGSHTIDEAKDNAIIIMKKSRKRIEKEGVFSAIYEVANMLEAKINENARTKQAKTELELEGLTESINDEFGDIIDEDKDLSAPYYLEVGGKRRKEYYVDYEEVSNIAENINEKTNKTVRIMSVPRHEEVCIIPGDDIEKILYPNRTLTESVNKVFSDEKAFEILQEELDSKYALGLLQKAVEGDREAFDKIKEKPLYCISVWSGAGYFTTNFYKSIVDFEDYEILDEELGERIKQYKDINADLNKIDDYNIEIEDGYDPDDDGTYIRLGDSNVYIYSENFGFRKGSWQEFINSIYSSSSSLV